MNSNDEDDEQQQTEAMRQDVLLPPKNEESSSSSSSKQGGEEEVKTAEDSEAGRAAEGVSSPSSSSNVGKSKRVRRSYTLSRKVEILHAFQLAQVGVESGRKGAFMETFCAEQGIPPPTLYKWLPYAPEIYAAAENMQGLAQKRKRMIRRDAWSPALDKVERKVLETIRELKADGKLVTARLVVELAKEYAEELEQNELSSKESENLRKKIRFSARWVQGFIQRTGEEIHKVRPRRKRRKGIEQDECGKGEPAQEAQAFVSLTEPDDVFKNDVEEDGDASDADELISIMEDPLLNNAVTD